MDDDARIQCEQTFRRGEQRIDVHLSDPRLIDHELGETYKQLFQGREVNGLASADALEGFVNARLLHHAAGQRRIEGRQAQGAVLENLDQLPAGPEEQYRAELWIQAAAKNQFVAI